MGSLRTLTILLTLGAWGAATEGAPPDGVAPTSAPTARPDPPAPPSEYVKAGRWLFDQGDYARAAQYFQAAHDYRDLLPPEDQAAVDDYRARLESRATMTGPGTAAGEPAPADAAPAAPGGPPSMADGASAEDSARASAASLVSQARQALSLGRPDEAARLARQAQDLGVGFASNEDSPERVLADIAAQSVPGRGEAVADDKQAARWKLRQAREALAMGRYDDAEQLVGEVRAMDVRWNLFDDTPDRVAKAIQKARPATAAHEPTSRGDKQQAKARLEEARNLLAVGQVDHAEAIAQEVSSWGHHFNLFEDSPDKVIAAVHAVRRRDEVRQAGSVAGTAQDLYNVAVQEARAALAEGRIDLAQQKAAAAQRMNVVPSLTSDRAEAVLHDIAMIRARQQMPSDGAPVAVPASIAAERQANELLAAGQRDAAAAKFLEAEQLRAREQGLAAATPTADPAVQTVQAEAPAQSLSLTPVEGSPEGAAAEPAAMAPAPADPAIEAPAALAGPAPEAPAAAADPIGALPAPADGEPVAADLPAPVAPAGEPVPEAVSPALEPAAMADLGASPALELNPTPTPETPANQGETMLSQAAALLSAGNYAEARQVAEQARAGGFGVEAQADDLLAQIALAAQGGTLKLYEAALDSLRRGDVERSRALLAEIASLENQDEVLMQKVQDLLARMPADAPGRATISAVDDAEAVRAQKLNIEVGAKVAESRRLQETDPDKAIALLEQTLAAIKAAEVHEAAAKTMTRRVEVALELAKKEKVTFDEKMKDKAYRAEIEQKRLRILEADKAKKAQYADLMEKSKEAEANGQYAEAEQFAKMAGEILPNDVAAVAQATKIRWMRRYERDKDIRAELDETSVTAMQEVSAAGIVPNEVQTRGIAYPKSFADLTRSRRDLADRLAQHKDPKTLEVEAKLNENITLEITDEQPLQQVVDYLASYTGLNIVVDPKALAEEGLTSSSPVKLKVKDISLKTALKLMLSPLGLTYKTEPGVLLITSPQASRSQTYAVAYPVGDLVISPHGRGQKSTPSGPTGSGINPSDPNAAAIDPGLNQASLTGPAAGSGFAVGPNVAGPSFTNSPQVTQGQPRLSREDFEPLVQLIRTSVAPGTWRDGPEDGYGGGYGLGAGFGGEGGLGLGEEQAIGSITPFFLNISLIIRHTSEVHDEIVDLLRQLRRLQDLQISVEVRFITVSDSFFEQIGVDFDFGIQSDVVGPKSSFAIPNPAAVPTAPGTTTGGTGTGGTAAVAPYLINPARDHAYGGRQPLTVGVGGPTDSISQPSFTNNLMIPFLQSSASAITPFNALTTNVGATFGLAFLSDLEVYLFLTAVQGDVRSNLVQAPKVTTFNGAPAEVFNFTQRNFVQAVVPVVGAGAVAFQPVVSGFPDGVQLFVTPVVSADRRYVRLTLSPVFQTLIQFDTFTTSAAVGGGGLGGQATGIQTQIQLPVFSLTQVSTTVTVPDGGTVLLGGVKRLREERREFGVPILAKTPLINRLFRNIGIGRTTDSLMLMVTPRIIILEEEEERLGIPAVQNVAF